ncbi:MAG: hypothetical protein BHW54_08725 [Subdoligranulum sp. 60_17]|nr:MAG: hypothetical protein BHW54_08725 [Subdoligranulum sp. 60_17]
MTISTAQQYCGHLKNQLLIGELLEVETTVLIARQFKIRILQITIPHEVFACEIVIPGQRFQATRALGINMSPYTQKQRCAVFGQRRRKVTYCWFVYAVAPEIRLREISLKMRLKRLAATLQKRTNIKLHSTPQKVA